MGISEEMFEVLAGKFIDGEITPAEQRLLDGELARDDEKRALFEQLQRLDEIGREAVSEQLAGSAAFEDVFERAWARRKGGVRLRITSAQPWWRFAAGLAAGLVIGLSLHFGANRSVVEPSEPNVGIGAVAVSESPAAVDPPVAAAPEQPGYGQLEPVDGMDRRVDWYGFTDAQGNRYIVEGYRQNWVVPASYTEDL